MMESTPKPKINEALLRCEKIYWALYRSKEREPNDADPFDFFGEYEDAVPEVRTDG
jgi:hypothetical protein